MDNKKQLINKHISDYDYHEFSDGKKNFDILIFPMLVEYIKDILVFLRVKKKAKIKVNELSDNGEIQVKCPYCQSVGKQKQITRNYFCPICSKKSYIDTSAGLSSFVLRKAYNMSRRERRKHRKQA